MAKKSMIAKSKQKQKFAVREKNRANFAVALVDTSATSQCAVFVFKTNLEGQMRRNQVIW